MSGSGIEGFSCPWSPMSNLAEPRSNGKTVRTDDEASRISNPVVRVETLNVNCFQSPLQEVARESPVPLTPVVSSRPPNGLNDDGEWIAKGSEDEGLCLHPLPKRTFFFPFFGDEITGSLGAKATVERRVPLFGVDGSSASASVNDGGKSNAL
ncbi:hypothetical protein BC829DRAFT_419903 [Chytridium lagenaria]|nr:hypothetical protein BC829DRAFT_419903 [Chytridium lagenaria]